MLSVSAFSKSNRFPMLLQASIKIQFMVRIILFLILPDTIQKVKQSMLFSGLSRSFTEIFLDFLRQLEYHNIKFF